MHGAINQIYEYPKGDFCIPLQLSDKINQAFVEEGTGNYDEIEALL